MGRNADPFTAAVKITLSRLSAKLGGPPLIDAGRLFVLDTCPVVSERRCPHPPLADARGSRSPARSEDAQNLQIWWFRTDN